jgi:hypothetical protein
MQNVPLSGAMRTRVIVVAVSVGILALVMLPLEILAVTSEHRDAGEIAFAFGVGIGLPLVFGALTWWGVRRWRRNPDLRRRQPNGPASRVLLFGNLITLTLANFARSLSGLEGWKGWALGLAVVVVGAVGVFLIARRLDPRLNYFRRPDPLPEGQEPEDNKAPAPW